VPSMCLRLHNFKKCLNGSDTVREANVRKHEGQYAEEEQKDGLDSEYHTYGVLDFIVHETVAFRRGNQIVHLEDA